MALTCAISHTPGGMPVLGGAADVIATKKMNKKNFAQFENCAIVVWIEINSHALNAAHFVMFLANPYP